MQCAISILLTVVTLFSAEFCHALTPEQSSQISELKSFVINGVHNKIYANVGGYLNTFELSSSGTLTSSVSVQNGTGTCTAGMMALDAKRLKLYISSGDTYTGSIYIYNITNAGLIDTSSFVYHEHKWNYSGMRTLFLDLANNLLISTGYNQPADYGVVVISQLDNNGIPVKSYGDTYTSGMSAVTPWYAALDGVNGYIYIADGVYHSGMMKVNNSGLPFTTYAGFWGPGNDGPFVLDSANKYLYFASDGGSPCKLWTLDDYGYYSTSVNLNINPQSIAIDPVRRRVFTGIYAPAWSKFAIFYNLNADGNIGTAFDTHYVVWGNFGSTIMYEPFFNKVYFISRSSPGDSLHIYAGPDPAMVPITINNGASSVDTPTVTINLQHSNPNFIYVSGDVSSAGSPVNNINQWKSCGGSMWKNPGDTMRASTLNVPMTLSAGYGSKTIEIWYSGSTGKDFTGMMRKASATISFLPVSASVTSISLSRIDYTGARIDYTAQNKVDTLVTVSIQYKTSKKDWTDATLSAGGESISNISATTTGFAHYVLWDIERDLENSAKDVQIRIKAHNGDADGAWLESEKYSVSEWDADYLKVVNASIKKPDGSYIYKMRVEWSGVADTSVSYELQKKEDFGDWSWVGITSGTSYEIENLSETPVYSFKVRLRTKQGLFSAYSKVTGLSLLGRKYGSMEIGKTGGIVYIEDFDENDANNSRVEVEEGTFREDVSITLESYEDFLYEISGKKTASNVNVIEKDFIKPVTLKLGYKREQILDRGWKEENLVILYFDGLKWIPIGGKVDTTNKLVIAKVSHFSKFRISENGEKPVVIVLPDYISPNNDGIADVVRFYFTSQELLENSEIRIYDITGKTIKAIKSTGATNTPQWDGRTDDGSLCETGIYVCVIESGKNKIIKTVRIVR